MKQLSDYNFINSWQLGDLAMQPLEKYRVLADIGKLKKGQVVKFIGFDDADGPTFFIRQRPAGTVRLV